MPLAKPGTASVSGRSGKQWRSSFDYVDGLTATRYQGPATGEAAHTGLNQWIGTFAGAIFNIGFLPQPFSGPGSGLDRRERLELGHPPNADLGPLLNLIAKVAAIAGTGTKTNHIVPDHALVSPRHSRHARQADILA